MSFVHIWKRSSASACYSLLLHNEEGRALTPFSTGAAQEDFKLAMQGIVCDTDKRVIDEAPAAYKDLTQARSRCIAPRVYETFAQVALRLVIRQQNQCSIAVGRHVC